MSELAKHAALLLLALLPVLIALSQPKISVTSPAVAVTAVKAGSEGETYVVAVHLPPLAKLVGEQLACFHGVNVTRAVASAGTAEVRGGCIFLTAENPSPRPVEVTVEVDLVIPEQRGHEDPSAALLVAAVAAASAAYLTLTESGRAKLFSAASIPAAYYVAKFSDVSKSPKRVRILEYLKENPGAHLRRISRETGISYGEVQWHLSVLERLGLVQSSKVGRYTCYFVTGAPSQTQPGRAAKGVKPYAQAQRS